MSLYSCSIWLYIKYSHHNTHSILSRSNMYCFTGTTWFLLARKNTFCYPGDTWLLLQVSCISASSCQQIRWTDRYCRAAIGWRGTVVFSHWLPLEKRCFPVVFGFPLSRAHVSRKHPESKFCKWLNFHVAEGQFMELYWQNIITLVVAFAATLFRRFPLKTLFLSSV